MHACMHGMRPSVRAYKDGVHAQHKCAARAAENRGSQATEENALGCDLAEDDDDDAHDDLGVNVAGAVHVDAAAALLLIKVLMLLMMVMKLLSRHRSAKRHRPPAAHRPATGLNDLWLFSRRAG